MRIRESFFPLQQWRTWIVLPLMLLGLQSFVHAQNSYTLVGERGGEQYFAKMHVVSKGETLYGLSRLYKVSINEIKTWNGLHSNTIDVGQRLIIETPAQESTSTSTTESEVAKSGPDRGTEEIAFESHLSDLFSNPNPPTNQGWETESMDNSEWSPFGGGMNSRGEAKEQTSFTRRSGSQETASEADAPSVRIKQVYYQVKRGDDIYSIADKYKVRVDQLRAWNAVVEVVPGDVIVVAKREIVSPTTNASNSSKQRGIPSRSMTAPLDARPSSTTSPTTAYRGGDLNAGVMRSDQEYLGNWMEKGAFIPYEGEKYKSTRFYGLHKSLPIGSTFKVMIPGNSGYFEVKVVGRLEAEKNAIAALSYDTIRLLEGGIQQSEVTIYYDK
ncbi:MAG: LysM peptidoglycan-binding domain-containing protein [Bacteroidota bacterium]